MFLAAVDKMQLLGYNYNVINYGVIIKVRLTYGTQRPFT